MILQHLLELPLRKLSLGTTATVESDGLGVQSDACVDPFEEAVEP